MDANQNRIIEAFRRQGWRVRPTHTLGEGFPDLVISRGGYTALVEIKDGSKPTSACKLTEDEQKFHADWQGDIFIVESVEDVRVFSNIKVKKR